MLSTGSLVTTSCEPFASFARQTVYTGVLRGRALPGNSLAARERVCPFQALQAVAHADLARQDCAALARDEAEDPVAGQDEGDPVVPHDRGWERAARNAEGEWPLDAVRLSGRNPCDPEGSPKRARMSETRRPDADSLEGALLLVQQRVLCRLPATTSRDCDERRAHGRCEHDLHVSDNTKSAIWKTSTMIAP